MLNILISWKDSVKRRHCIVLSGRYGAQPNSKLFIIAILRVTAVSQGEPLYANCVVVSQCHYNLTGVDWMERYRTSSTAWQHTNMKPV